MGFQRGEPHDKRRRPTREAASRAGGGPLLRLSRPRVTVRPGSANEAPPQRPELRPGVAPPVVQLLQGTASAVRLYDHRRSMSMFRRTDPSLRPLIAYMVGRARGRGITLNRTKLVKLLYLIDIERVRARRDALTGLQWVFFHYGPYAFELIDTLEAMEGSELSVQLWHGSVLYRGAPGAPEGDDWPATTKATVDRIIDRFAPLDLNELLDYVYFRTGPMIDAQRGQPLDMSRAREDPPARRPIPLRAPARPDDVEERLAQWRARTARRLAPVTLDPPGVFLDDPDDDLTGEGVRGRLHVPNPTEL